jgi:hypothetical protein
MRKIANVEPLGYFIEGGRKEASKKSAGRRIISSYMEEDLVIPFQDILADVADFYKISSDPRDYLLIPARAVSADRPNENMDGWDYEELVRFDPRVGRRVYRTFEAKPHFVNHKSDNPLVSRGVILDATLNDKNAADSKVKEAVFKATGRVVDKDIFVECLIAMDTTKDPILAKAYKEGSVDKFSMGCDVEYTVCSYCGNKAASVGQFCNHIRNKLSKKSYIMPDGRSHVPYERCGQTIFQELSVVDLPADRSAQIQEGLLEVYKSDSCKRLDLPNRYSSRKMSREEMSEISSYIVKNAKNIPESLARVLLDLLRD